MEDQGVDLPLPEALGKKNSRSSSSRSIASARYERLSQLDEEFLKELEKLPPLGSLSVEEERARMRASQTTVLSDYPIKARNIQTSACPVHLIQPAQTVEPASIIFFLHGGGWVLGDIYTHLKLVCELAMRTGYVVAFVEYPRAPEYRYPVSLEACTTAIYEVLQSAEELGLNRKRFAIGGDSSGGNLAAAVILSAIERNLDLPSCQFMLYPVTNYGCATASYEEFSTNPNLSRKTMEWFWGHYLVDSSQGSDPHVSPLTSGDSMLSQFPPTLIVTCEYDVLRDEGEQFAARLINSGVRVTAMRWLGALHGFLVTESLAASASAQSCIDTIAAYLRKELCQA